MLNYPGAERFFENCLAESGLAERFNRPVSLAEARSNPDMRGALLRALRDIQSGADAIQAKGKPAEETLGLSGSEWERRWTAWASSRKAAFYTRAAMLMLGETEFFPYFIKVLDSSFNLVFLGAAKDVLQHASGCYLNGPQEDFSNEDLARWWEQQYAAGRLNLA